MSFDTLKEQSQINKARKVLVARKLSSLKAPFYFLLKKIGLSKDVLLGDFVKSWDVLNTLLFIEKNLKTEDPILDIGCYASEIIVALHKDGFKKLTGADLNPELNKMPFNHKIRYVNTNFMRTNFPNNSFKAVTAISVIEHGFNAHGLLKEMSRIIMPGGYFISSFDYWPEKIDTTDIKFFGIDWIIFSKEDVKEFVSLAANYNFFPVGEMSYKSQTAIIKCANKEYTFGWLVLEKRT